MENKRKRKKPQDIANYWCGEGSDTPGFQIQYYHNKGRGVITLIKRHKGDFLYEYAGEVISADEENERESKGSYGYRFFFRNFCIDATEETERLGRVVNHGNKKKEIL